jgi:hypothetical protein
MKEEHMRYLFALLAFICFTNVSQASTLDSQDAARKLTDEAMIRIISGDLDGGFLLIKPYMIVPESEFNVMLEKAKLQLPMIQGRFGKSLGAEFIKEKTVGKSLLQIVQIQKFEKHILCWKFTFYKPVDKWVLDSFTFDDNMLSLFEQI